MATFVSNVSNVPVIQSVQYQVRGATPVDPFAQPIIAGTPTPVVAVPPLPTLNPAINGTPTPNVAAPGAPPTFYAPIAEIGARALLDRPVNQPRLYIHRISADSLAPWMLLREKDIPFELIMMDPTRGETYTSDFLAMSPMGKLPVFVGSDELVVWETNTIMRYICEKYPADDYFYPRDVNLRGRVEMALDWRQTVLMPSLMKVAYPYLGFSKDKSQINEGKLALDRDLKVLTDFFLRETPFIGGPSPCIADYAIALPLLYLYATDYHTPGKIREYLEHLAAKTPCWNEVTDGLKNFMATLK